MKRYLESWLSETKQDGRNIKKKTMKIQYRRKTWSNMGCNNYPHYFVLIIFLSLDFFISNLIIFN
jgi:hypothetical protein